MSVCTLCSVSAELKRHSVEDDKVNLLDTLIGLSVTGYPLPLWSTQLLACVEILKLSTNSFETRI